MAAAPTPFQSHPRNDTRLELRIPRAIVDQLRERAHQLDRAPSALARNSHCPRSSPGADRSQSPGCGVSRPPAELELSLERGDAARHLSGRESVPCRAPRGQAAGSTTCATPSRPICSPRAPRSPTWRRSWATKPTTTLAFYAHWIPSGDKRFIDPLEAIRSSA